jgi:hypothetical protein
MNDPIQEQRYREYLEFYDASENPPMSRWLFDLITKNERDRLFKQEES